MVERSVLVKGLQHPFLVGLHFSFQTPNMLYFVLDYVNGGEVWVSLRNVKVDISGLSYRFVSHKHAFTQPTWSTDFVRDD